MSRSARRRWTVGVLVMSASLHAQTPPPAKNPVYPQIAVEASPNPAPIDQSVTFSVTTAGKMPLGILYQFHFSDGFTTGWLPSRSYARTFHVLATNSLVTVNLGTASPATAQSSTPAPGTIKAEVASRFFSVIPSGAGLSPTATPTLTPTPLASGSGLPTSPVLWPWIVGGLVALIAVATKIVKGKREDPFRGKGTDPIYILPVTFHPQSAPLDFKNPTADGIIFSIHLNRHLEDLAFTLPVRAASLS